MSVFTRSSRSPRHEGLALGSYKQAPLAAGEMGLHKQHEDNDPAGFRQREVSQCPESCAVPARLSGVQQGALQK